MIPSLSSLFFHQAETEVRSYTFWYHPSDLISFSRIASPSVVTTELPWRSKKGKTSLTHNSVFCFWTRFLLKQSFFFPQKQSQSAFADCYFSFAYITETETQDLKCENEDVLRYFHFFSELMSLLSANQNIMTARVFILLP